MGRLLAIDYGKKRTGIAVSDPLQIIANGLTTVETSRLLDFLRLSAKGRGFDNCGRVAQTDEQRTFGKYSPD